MSQLSPLYTSPSKLAVTVSTNHTQTLIRKCYLMMTSSLITMSLCTLGKCCLMITNASTFYSCCTSGIKMSFTNQALTAGFLHPTTSFRLSSLTLAVFLCLFFWLCAFWVLSSWWGFLHFVLFFPVSISTLPGGYELRFALIRNISLSSENRWTGDFGYDDILKKRHFLYEFQVS